MRAELACTRAVPGARPLLSTVLEAILKETLAEAGLRRRDDPGAGDRSPFFHVMGRAHDARPAEGERFRVEFLFCRCAVEEVEAWRRSFTAWFAASRPDLNHALLDLGPVEGRGLADLEAEQGPAPSEGEICLEFLTPVPFTRLKDKPATHLPVEALPDLFLRRYQRLFGREVACDCAGDELLLLSHLWRRVEAGVPSRSQPGHDQHIKGCVGRLYLRGSFPGLAPLLLLGTELHAGAKRSHAQGYYRLHREAPPFFAGFFPRAGALRAVVESVLQRYDAAAAEIAVASGGTCAPPAVAAGIAAEITGGSYAPAPHQGFRIPKRSGGSRLVERVPFRDLVVHQYLLRTLAPFLDRLLETSAVAFRRGASRERTAELIRGHIADGFRFVVESDVEDFFPSVDLEGLLRVVDRCLPKADTALRRTLMAVLLAPCLVDGVLKARGRGIAQGSPLSPLLANLYLDAFDERIAGPDARLLRYADDFVVLTRTREAAEALLERCREGLDELGLSLNQEKTAIRSVEEGFTFLGMRFGASETETQPEEDLRRMKKPLYLVEQDLFLALNGEAVDVRRGGSVVQTVPLRRIGEVLVLGRAAFSSALVAACVGRNIPLTLTAGSGYYVTTVKPDSKRYYETAVAHALRHAGLGETERLVVAKEFAAGKVAGYGTLFRQRYVRGAEPFLATLGEAVERIRRAGTLEEVRGHEGAAARAVYPRLNTLIDHGEFHVKKREREHPDRINSLLNFGYYLLFTRVNATLRAAGLNPYLGFLHSPSDDYESLVCDVEELFRSQIDRLIVRLVNLKVLTPADFYEADGGWRLTSGGIAKYVHQFEGEMVRKPRNGGLTIEERIIVQVGVLKKWALEGATLSFQVWA